MPSSLRSERQSLTVSRNDRRPVELFVNVVRQGFGCLLLAVHHEDAVRFPVARAHPVDQSIGVRMHAETGEIADLGSHANVSAMDLEFLNAVEQLPTACASRLETNQNDGVARVGKELCKVMNDPATRGHAGPCDDDRRFGSCRDCLRPIRVVHLGKVWDVKYIVRHVGAKIVRPAFVASRYTRSADNAIGLST